MESHLLPIFAFATFVFLGVNATPPAAEIHWKSMLPNTPLPKSLQNLLVTADSGNKNSDQAVDQELMTLPSNIDYFPKYQGREREVNKEVISNWAGIFFLYDNLFLHRGKRMRLVFPKSTNKFLFLGVNATPPAAEIYRKSMLPNTPLPKSLQNLLVTADGGNKNSDQAMDQDLTVPKLSGYFRTYQGREREVNKEVISNWTAIFFLYDNLFLHPGKTMRLVLPKSTDKVSFLPHNIAQSTPFSSDKLPSILKKFSVKPRSKQAQIMKDTIEECEAPNQEGEDKHCATSLESMVDFAISKFGHKVNILCNVEVEKENKNKKINEEKGYIINSMGVKKLGAKQIVCHKQEYVYAVFYCHILDHTETYMVPLVGDDGSKTKALAICHKDTSNWDSKYIAFQLLNIKPGKPLCHLLNSDAIVWFP